MTIGLSNEPPPPTSHRSSSHRQTDSGTDQHLCQLYNVIRSPHASDPRGSRFRTRGRAKASLAAPASSISLIANLETRCVAGRLAAAADQLDVLLCRGCGSRRCACWQPDSR